MSRFIVVADPRGYDDPQGFTEGLDDWDYSEYVVDTKSNQIVFKDGSEPEDASLSRHYRPLVVLLNRVAEE
jgi:hypothetical protein